MPTVVSLPPPVTFEHKETLHRIELPPLARFLHTLTSPPQLIKLNEILNRYRTPKSYHRIDVREIGSSELPISNSPEPEVPRLNDQNHPHHDATYAPDGAPIELDDGVTIEEVKESRAVKHGEDEPSSPEATHPLPPAGPTRRIRELRVDLRTLDPAALFTLEKWRREVLKLEDLPFDHPDSIWYRSPTPEPIVKKKGRPMKARTSASAQIEEPAIVNLTGMITQASTPNTSVCAAIGQAVAAAITWADGQEMNGIERFDRMVDGPGPSNDTNTPVAPVAPVAPAVLVAPDAPVAPGVEPTQSALEDLFGTEDPTQPTVTVPEATSEPQHPRSPSPVPLLVDAFDHDPDKDPDYAPRIPAPARRSGRPREKTQPTASSSRSAFTKVASPVPMLSTKPTVSPASKRALRKAASPIPVIPIEPEQPIALDRDESEESETVELDDIPLPPLIRTPVVEIAQKRRRISPSISVSRRSVSPPQLSAGTSSNIPIDISGSPEPQVILRASAPVPPPKKQSAFQPFIREPMRMPTTAGSARPQWLKDLPDLDPSLDDMSSRNRGSKAGSGSGSGSDRSSTKRIKKSNTGGRRAREVEDNDDDISIIEPSEVGMKNQKRKTISRDDEWADFMF